MGNMCAKPPPPAYEKEDEASALLSTPPPYADNNRLVQGFVVRHGGDTGRVMCPLSALPPSRAFLSGTEICAADDFCIGFWKSKGDYSARVKAYFTKRPGGNMLTPAHPLECFVPSQIPGFVRIVVDNKGMTAVEGNELSRMLERLFEHNELPTTVELYVKQRYGMSSAR